MSDESKPKLKYPAKSFFYSVAEAAMILRVSTKAIRTWIDDGLLPAFRIGPETRITRIRSQDLDDFINQYSSGFTVDPSNADQSRDKND